MSDRILMDMDAKIEVLQKEILRLKEERKEREGLLRDPNYMKIKGLYQKIADCIDELDRLGEDTHGPLSEYDEQLSIEIAGKTFTYFGGEITEN